MAAFSSQSSAFHLNDNPLTGSDTYANSLLGHANDANQSQSLYMYLLHSGSPGNHQDQLFWEVRGSQTDNGLIPVSEPASLALTVAALGGLAISRRRKSA